MNSNKVNAINPEMLNDFESALSKMEASTLPIVLTGEPGNSTMCAGLDLAYLFGCDKQTSRERTFSVLSRLGVCIERLHTLPRPTVIALSGHALAGGDLLVFRCVFVVTSSGIKALSLPTAVIFVLDFAVVAQDLVQSRFPWEFRFLLGLLSQRRI